jgi:hypothetical protein
VPARDARWPRTSAAHCRAAVPPRAPVVSRLEPQLEMGPGPAPGRRARQRRARWAGLPRTPGALQCSPAAPLRHVAAAARPPASRLPAPSWRAQGWHWTRLARPSPQPRQAWPWRVPPAPVAWPRRVPCGRAPAAPLLVASFAAPAPSFRALARAADATVPCSRPRRRPPRAPPPDGAAPSAQEAPSGAPHRTAVA